jgi:hypothetical protein
MLGISRFLEKDAAFLFDIRSESRGANGSRQIIVKKAEKKAKDAFLYESRLTPSNDFIQSNLSKLALCEIYNYYFDQAYYLHKLWLYSQKNNIEITDKYYQRVIREYRLNSFLPIR